MIPGSICTSPTSAWRGPRPVVRATIDGGRELLGQDVIMNGRGAARRRTFVVLMPTTCWSRVTLLNIASRPGQNWFAIASLITAPGAPVGRRPP